MRVKSRTKVIVGEHEDSTSRVVSVKIIIIIYLIVLV